MLLNVAFFADSSVDLSPWLTSQASKPTPTQHKTQMEFSSIRACCELARNRQLRSGERRDRVAVDQLPSRPAAKS